jgi:hypothetical protein
VGEAARHDALDQEEQAGGPDPQLKRFNPKLKGHFGGLFYFGQAMLTA